MPDVKMESIRVSTENKRPRPQRALSWKRPSNPLPLLTSPPPPF